MESQVYSVKVPYTKANGNAAEVNVPLVDIPSGTLLFRGIRLPNIETGDDPRKFVRDFLGTPQGGHFCLSPTRNNFFYPFPHVVFGANIYGERFNAVMIYQTSRNLKIACMISPSKWIRGGDIKKLDGTAPIQRCDKFPYICDEGLSAEQIAKEKEAQAWDNCIRPEWAVESGVSGWMAIADYDSLDNFDVRGKAPKDTSMGKYLLELNETLPAKVPDVLVDMYADNRRHRGIPEIALYPWSPHPGPENQYTDATNEEEAAVAISELADKFNFLPVACITTEGILEAFSGDFKASDLPGGATVSVASADARKKMDLLMNSYMERLKTTGVEVPGLGTAKAVFDSRTGFYVMDLFKPDDITFTKDGTEISYSDLLMPLSTPAEQAQALEYKILFRANFPAKQFSKHTLEGGKEVRRAFIFERPPLLRNMFTDLRIDMPAPIVAGMRRAAALFQTNRGAKGGALLKKKNQTRKQQRGGENGNSGPSMTQADTISPQTQDMVKGYLGSAFRAVWQSWIQKKSNQSYTE